MRASGVRRRPTRWSLPRRRVPSASAARRTCTPHRQNLRQPLMVGPVATRNCVRELVAQHERCELHISFSPHAAATTCRSGPASGRPSGTTRKERRRDRSERERGRAAVGATVWAAGARREPAQWRPRRPAIPAHVGKGTYPMRNRRRQFCEREPPSPKRPNRVEERRRD